MNDIKQKMIQRARDEFTLIKPCRFKQALEDCFTIQGDKVIFWFNTGDETTRIICEELPDHGN